MFCDKKSEDQELPAPGTSTRDAVVDSVEHENGPRSKYFYFLIMRSVFIQISSFLPNQKGIPATRERKKDGQRRQVVRVGTAILFAFR